MGVCAFCKNDIEIDKYFSRKTSCPSCKGDLHICLNCKFYSQTSHNKCLEPKAEFQRIRDRANFCDYFVFMLGTAHGASGADKEDARKRLEALFKK
jgi:hypothetical protein